MISQEFKAAVTSKNLLRTKIMLKDSFVVDPTFVQLEEMLTYAKANIPDIFVPFDGEYLENDESKWNKNTMNEELVQLVTNFSELRVQHLKKVVTKVLESEVAKIRQKRIEQQQSTHSTISSRFTTVGNREYSSLTREVCRRKALNVLQNEGSNIQNIMNEVNLQHTWKLTNIDDIERSARKILRAVQDYKNNR